jgi:hypothetical protein
MSEFIGLWSRGQLKGGRLSRRVGSTAGRRGCRPNSIAAARRSVRVAPSLNVA